MPSRVMADDRSPALRPSFLYMDIVQTPFGRCAAGQRFPAEEALNPAGWPFVRRDIFERHNQIRLSVRDSRFLLQLGTPVPTLPEPIIVGAPSSVRK